MSLRELYQEMILDHGRQPRNFGELSSATHVHAGHNPLCGDKLMLYVKVENGIIEAARFNGEGCAICMASASLMTEAVKQLSLPQAHHLFEGFHQLVTTGEAPDMDLGKLAVFSGVAEFPIRVKCATLAWHTLEAALANKPDPVSTE